MFAFTFVLAHLLVHHIEAEGYSLSSHAFWFVSWCVP